MLPEPWCAIASALRLPMSIDIIFISCSFQIENYPFLLKLMQEYQNFDLVSKKSYLKYDIFGGKTESAGPTRLKFLSHIDQIICEHQTRWKLGME